MKKLRTNIAIPEIIFENIRPIDNSKNLGFEEFAVQLFRLKFGIEKVLNRVGGKGGDSGVECFWHRKGYGTIGLQAKYLNTLKNKKPQLEKSLKSALSNHPKLRQYIFVLPYDRIKKGNSDEFKLWNNWVNGWKKYALESFSKKSFTIKWTGKEEIKGLLLDHSAKSLIEYYFGYETFTVEQLRSIFDDAVEDLGDRYTPTINVQTRAELELEAFFGLSNFLNRYQECVIKLKKISGDFYSNFPGKPTYRIVISRTRESFQVWKKLDGILADGKSLPNYDTLFQTLSEYKKIIDTLKDDVIRYHKKTIHREKKLWEDSPWRSRLELVRKLSDIMYHFFEFLGTYYHWRNNTLLLTGPAGSGKSHLLAEIGIKLWSEGNPTILLLGNRFKISKNPWLQALEIIGFDSTTDIWLGLLNTLSESIGKIGIVIVDAINESEFSKFWKTELIPFCRKIKKYNFLRIVVSCRSDFAEYCIPSELLDRENDSWSRINHYGFDIDLFQGITLYFSEYEIQSDLFPPILNEFRLPLFLKIFCDAYAGKKIEAHHLSLTQIFNAHKKKIVKNVSESITCDERDVIKAIDLICEKMIETGNHFVPADEIRTQINEIVFPIDATKSLYNQLRSNGLIRESGFKNKEPEVSFTFERFYDFYIAQKILEDYPTINHANADFKNKGRLHDILSDYDSLWSNSGIIGAFSILFPEIFGKELIDRFKKPHPIMWETFYESLRWRKGNSITSRTEEILRNSEDDIYICIKKYLIEFAAIPNHRFNSEFIFNELFKVKLSLRDEKWSLPISSDAYWDSDCQENNFINWCDKIPTGWISSDQTTLAVSMLCWFFCSTNVNFRDKATRAAIRLLAMNPISVTDILDKFDKINDPYIRERVYAAVAGSVMRCFDRGIIKKIAGNVYRRIFKTKKIAPHILLREYARCVMERALYLDALPDNVKINNFRPPYNSQWPGIKTTDSDIEKLRKKDGASSLVLSMRLESEGGYGDFGRYVFESRIHNFSKYKFNEIYRNNGRYSYNSFDTKIAKRYVFDRIIELGWTPEGLGKLEGDFVQYEGRKRPEIERISKKYQYIGMYEILGYLTDHCRPLRSSFSEHSEIIEGAWQLNCRDFDPSNIDLSEKSSERENSSNFWWCPYPNPISDRFGNDWLYSKYIDDIRRCLIIKDKASESNWINLCSYYGWNEKYISPIVELSDTYRDVWLHIRSWQVPIEYMSEFIKKIQNIHFWGNGLMLPENWDGWIGEYPWGVSFLDFANFFKGDYWWLDKGSEKPSPILLTAGFIGNPQWLVPSPQTLIVLKAHWTGDSLNFSGEDNDSVRPLAFNPSANISSGPQAVLIDKEKFLRALKKENKSLVWGVLGERRIMDNTIISNKFHGSFEFSGVFWIDKGKVKGGITKRVKKEPFGR